MADWKDILSENNEQLSDEDLLKYLDPKVPKEEKYGIEKKLADTFFESDAVDGLQQIKSPGHVKSHVEQLNRKLQQQLVSKKYRKQKKNLKDFEWVLIAILILLITCTIAYAVILLV